MKASKIGVVVFTKQVSYEAKAEQAAREARQENERMRQHAQASRVATRIPQLRAHFGKA